MLILPAPQQPTAVFHHVHVIICGGGGTPSKHKYSSGALSLDKQSRAACPFMRIDCKIVTIPPTPSREIHAALTRMDSMEPRDETKKGNCQGRDMKCVELNDDSNGLLDS